MQELKVVLANLLRRFQFSLLHPSQTITPLFGSVLKPKGGMRLAISKRSTKA
jgi:cytochrome P450